MTKFARFIAPDGAIQHGIVKDSELHLIAGDLFGAWHSTDQVLSLSNVKLLAPIVPPNILAIGLNYRAHAQESNMQIPDHPVLFIKATNALCNPGDPIILPRAAPDEVDYECELAIVIGRQAHHVPAERALDYVFGYTCANDVSARDCQNRLDRQWARAKSFDTFAPLGPWIETEVDLDRMETIIKVNGRETGRFRTNDMIFGIKPFIVELTKYFTLWPGDVIWMGTDGASPDLKAGDVVEIEITGIGTLRNRFVKEAAPGDR